MIHTIFFDLDGTLVDSLPGVQYSFQAAWDAAGLALPCPSVRPLMGPPVGEMFRRALPKADDATIAALVKAFRADYEQDGWRRTMPFPGVLEALARLTADGVRCLGVTNKPTGPTQRILDYCGLRPFFTIFLSPDSRTPPWTSKAQTLLSLLTEERLERAGAVLMGDTLEDARAALSCGVRFLAFRGGYGWESLQAEARWVCPDFAALPALVRDLPGLAPSGSPR